MFFFYKQKTAYEMRISDWSSDVCSSDLGLDRHVAQGHARLRRQAFDGLPDVFDRIAPRALRAQAMHHINHQVLDRKSVVSGQSVSVRVDLGGRSIFK